MFGGICFGGCTDVANNVGAALITIGAWIFWGSI